VYLLFLCANLHIFFDIGTTFAKNLPLEVHFSEKCRNFAR
jgi:hypothetical protein